MPSLASDHYPEAALENSQEQAQLAAIHQIDREILACTEAINAALKAVTEHPHFQEVKATWTSVWELVSTLNDDEDAILELLNLSPEEFLSDSEGLYHHLYTQQWDMPGEVSTAVCTTCFSLPWTEQLPQQLLPLRDLLEQCHAFCLSTLDLPMTLPGPHSDWRDQIQAAATVRSLGEQWGRAFEGWQGSLGFMAQQCSRDGITQPVHLYMAKLWLDTAKSHQWPLPISPRKSQYHVPFAPVPEGAQNFLARSHWPYPLSGRLLPLLEQAFWDFGLMTAHLYCTANIETEAFERVLCLAIPPKQQLSYHLMAQALARSLKLGFTELAGLQLSPSEIELKLTKLLNRWVGHSAGAEPLSWCTYPLERAEVRVTEDATSKEVLKIYVELTPQGGRNENHNHLRLTFDLEGVLS